MFYDRSEIDNLLFAAGQIKGLGANGTAEGKKHTRTGVTVTPLQLRKQQRRAKNKVARQTRKKQQARARK